jgi:uncharacterized protein with PQ loop repeat
LTPNSLQIFQFFKYAVYALLTLNIFLFFNIEWAGAAVRFADGVELADIIEGFVATIDTAAWVVLLLMFELETYVLEDKHFTRRVSISLHTLRAICYAFIVYSFYGYLIKLIYILGATPLIGVSDLCTLVADNWSYATDLDEYVLLTSENCASMSSATSFQQYSGLSAAVDQAGLSEITRLAWVDVINSAVWLLIVVVLEIDVRLQEHGRLTGLALRLSRVSKFILYPTLLLAAIYWGIKGDFVDFWDAFLWLVAFIFIELNVFEWRQESLAETSGAITPN